MNRTSRNTALDGQTTCGPYRLCLVTRFCGQVFEKIILVITVIMTMAKCMGDMPRNTCPKILAPSQNSKGMRSVHDMLIGCSQTASRFTATRWGNCAPKREAKEILKVFRKTARHWEKPMIGIPKPEYPERDSAYKPICKKQCELHSSRKSYQRKAERCFVNTHLGLQIGNAWKKRSQGHCINEKTKENSILWGIVDDVHFMPSWSLDCIYVMNF